MNFQIITISQKAPTWINEASKEYIKRCSTYCSLSIKEISPVQRKNKSSTDVAKNTESEKLLAAVPKSSLIVALDSRGKQWSSEQLAENFQDWQLHWRHVSLLVGGADGLAKSCLDRADTIWSLGKLTYPHMMVRVLLVEQIYRAWTIVNRHPYHAGHA